MRKLFVRRWVTIAVMAAGLVGLTATSASADVDFSPVPIGSAIVGPGCDTDYGFWARNSGDWFASSPNDYADVTAYMDDYGEGSCDGTAYSAITDTTQTARFSWFYEADQPYAQNCQVYAYIPTVDAGDQDTRYDFYAEDGNGNQTWLAWPGATVNQESISGWVHIGGAIVPAYTTYLDVVLSNASAYPGWWVGAGDMAFYCTHA